jgi:allantoinase
MPETYDLVVRNAQIVTGLGVRPATIAVREGRIAAVLESGARALAAADLDATGLHVLPGVIDPHVHTRHPGLADREDFESGTAAAAAGGITTVLEMPISTIPTNSRAAVERRVAAMQPGAFVDFGLYGGAGDESVEAIAEQAEAGVVAFKTFLQPPPPARLGEFTGLWSLDPARRRDVVRAVAATGLPHAFHCEDAPTYLALQQHLEAAGRFDGPAHAESRPPIVEEISVAQVLGLAAEAGGRPHVVHLSSPRSADLVRDARARGVRATAETCPPYLFLTDEVLRTHGGFARCNPPLRSAADVAALWRRVAGGLIDVIGTDHSPFLEAEKLRGAENIFLAPPGLCGLELLVPLMLTAAADGRLTLPDLARLLSERTAAVFSLGHKGRIAVGADADLTLVNLAADWVFDHRLARTKSRANMRVFDGMRLRGRVAATLVRGAIVFRDGELTGRRGHGRFLRPSGPISG